MKLKELLKANPLFANLTEEQLDVLVPLLEKKVYQKDEFVFEEGAPSDGMFIIVYGGIKINKQIDGVRKKTLASMSDGQFFGEMSLVDGYPRSATALTTRESVLYRFSTESYQKLMGIDSYIALNISLAMCGWISMRLRAANLEIANLENWKLLHDKEGKW